uniref:Transmembrane 6 superfamily member 1/2 transmembrane domain-containing protein n=1 Tax=Strix occidentalis caurina TaxID=311401 RepID=A0A8D0FKJ7_STROC
MLGFLPSPWRGSLFPTRAWVSDPAFLWASPPRGLFQTLEEPFRARLEEGQHSVPQWDPPPCAGELGLILFHQGTRSELTRSPAVFVAFSFTSVVDLIISLEEDGYISGFVEVYIREGEPHLRTAHGILICYWDGIIHYGLYLAMIAAIGQRKSYRNLGLFWLGSLMMSIVVFLLGNLIGTGVQRVADPSRLPPSPPFSPVGLLPGTCPAGRGGWC